MRRRGRHDAQPCDFVEQLVSGFLEQLPLVAELVEQQFVLEQRVQQFELAELLLVQFPFVEQLELAFVQQFELTLIEQFELSVVEQLEPILEQLELAIVVQQLERRR